MMEQINEIKLDLMREVDHLPTEVFKHLTDQFKFLGTMPDELKLKIISFLSGLWTKMSTVQPVPLSADLKDSNFQDYQRYQNLCDLYRKYSKGRAIPVYWNLDAQFAPQWKADFNILLSQFRSFRTSIPTLTPLISRVVDALLNRMYSLLQDLAKAKTWWQHLSVLSWKSYREDGVEMMFLSELSIWMSVTLLNSDPYSDSTLALIQERILFCEAVDREVLFSRSDEDVNSPRYFLTQFITEMQTLHDELSADMKFNQRRAHLTKLDNLFSSGLIKNTLDWIYHLMEGASQSVLNVPDVLGLSCSDVDSINFFNSCLVGQWLNKTLMRLGVVSNIYTPSPFVKLSYNQIEMFLDSDLNEAYSGRYPAKMDPSGLCAFVSEKKELEFNCMIRIRDILRAVLKVAFIQQQLTLSKKIIQLAGNGYIRSTGKGQTTFGLLELCVSNAAEELVTKMSDFWRFFYQQNYIDQKFNEHKTHKSNWQSLGLANDIINSNDVILKQIVVCVADIKKCIDPGQNPERAQFMNKLQATLVKNLEDYAVKNNLDYQPDHLHQSSTTEIGMFSEQKGIEILPKDVPEHALPAVSKPNAGL